MRRLLPVLLLLFCARLSAEQKPALTDAQKQKLDTLIGKLASDDFATRKQAFAALKELLLRLNGTGKTEALRAFLKQRIERSRDAQIKEYLERLWVIVRFGVTDVLLKVMPELLECLTSRSKEERLQVISRLEKLWRKGISDAAKPLIGFLKDMDAEVRRAAAKALDRIKAKEAVKPLIAALKDKDDDVRCVAAVALGSMKAKEAVKPLIAALKDDYWRVRLFAADALGEIKAKEAVRPLITALKDDDRRVRRAAAEALMKITGKDFGRDHNRWLKWWQKQQK